MVKQNINKQKCFFRISNLNNKNNNNKYNPCININNILGHSIGINIYLYITNKFIEHVTELNYIFSRHNDSCICNSNIMVTASHQKIES